MFDYIVKKERLQESEARHFFRQLVQAIAYVHNMGFAHRDLKPVSFCNRLTNFNGAYCFLFASSSSAYV